MLSAVQNYVSINFTDGKRQFDFKYLLVTINIVSNIFGVATDGRKR